MDWLILLLVGILQGYGAYVSFSEAGVLAKLLGLLFSLTGIGCMMLSGMTLLNDHIMKRSKELMKENENK